LNLRLAQSLVVSSKKGFPRTVQKFTKLWTICYIIHIVHMATVFRLWTGRILVAFLKYESVVIIRIPSSPSHFQLMHTQGQIMICWPSFCRLALLPQSTYIYKVPQSMSPRRNCDSPNPSLASECALPP
jgi:hypothetical protein